MCGDLDNDADDTTLAAYRGLALRLLKGRPAQAAGVAPEEEMPAYMSRLFQDVIARACADAGASDTTDAGLMVAQAVVLARAAGVLAAQLNLTEDPLRQVMEALMDGYASEQGGRRRIDHDHHDHGHHHHGHEHDHEHGHHHHHHG
jgi:hypothetical protein